MAYFTDLGKLMNIKYPAVCLILSVLLSACDLPSQTTTNSTKVERKAEMVPTTQAMSQFANDFTLNAYEQLSKAVTEVEKLDRQLVLFISTPKQETLKQARRQWRQTYNAYLQAQIYFYLPIKDPVEWQQKRISHRDLFNSIDRFPIEGGYIDYVQGYPFSGLVNDLTLNINATSVIEQHQLADPSYASLGFHVLEFLLWGNDGKRVSSDYYNQKNQKPILNQNNEKGPPALVQNHIRRRKLLQFVSEKLLKDMHQIKQRWQPSNGFYAQTLTRSKPQSVVAAMLKASWRLFSEEMIAQRLKLNSSEFSQSTADDVLALTQSVVKLYQLGAKNEETAPFLFNSKSDLQQDWHNQSELLLRAINTWKDSKTLQAQQEAQKNVEQQLQQSVLLMRRIAEGFHVRLQPKVTK